MDLFFTDLNEVPLPPEEVRLRDLRAEPWPNGRRVKVSLEIEPFQKRPSADLVIRNAAGEEVASANILETISRKLEINLHLREANPSGEYTLAVVLYYQKLDAYGEEGGQDNLPEPLVVDRKQVSFTITPGS
jgi:hypothetical protein